MIIVLCLCAAVTSSYTLLEMDATQVISDSVLESDEEENEEENDNERQPVAKLCILKNEHIPETGEWLTASVTVCDVHKQPSLCVSYYYGYCLSPRVTPLCGRQCAGT